MTFSAGVPVLTSPNTRLPDPWNSPADGPVAVGGDRSSNRLIEAYEKGIFPWFSDDDGPVLWWSPDPRAILPLEDFKPSKSLRKVIRKGYFHLTFDQAFSEVVSACAEPRPNSTETWITPNMQRAYIALHELELGHSVECWRGEELVGGLYGISLGSMFFGESMFSKVSNASKVALAGLVDHLSRWSFTLLDCQIMNPHLCSLGAIDMPRNQFLSLLLENRRRTTRMGPWAYSIEHN